MGISCLQEDKDEEEVVGPQLPALKPIRMPPVADEDNFCSVCGDEDEDDPEYASPPHLID